MLLTSNENTFVLSFNKLTTLQIIKQVWCNLLHFYHSHDRMMHQISKWNEDWNEWKKEIHIQCTHEVSKKKLPKKWLRKKRSSKSFGIGFLKMKHVFKIMF